MSSVYLQLAAELAVEVLDDLLVDVERPVREHVQSPIAVFGWSTSGGPVGRVASCSAGPRRRRRRRAARRAPDSASPVEPARPTNRRRDRRSSASRRSSARLEGTHPAMRGLLGDDEGVLRVPGEQDVAARPERLAARSPRRSARSTVSSSPPGARIRYWSETPRKAATLDLAAQDVGARGRSWPAGDERELLRADADADVALRGAAAVAARAGVAPSCVSTRVSPPSAPRSLRVDEVRDAEEVGDELGARAARRARWPSRAARCGRRSSPRSRRPSSWPPPGRA